MPEIMIQMAEEDEGELNRILDHIWDHKTDSTKNTKIAHMFVRKLIQQSYELGKQVGEAGLN